MFSTTTTSPRLESYQSKPFVGKLLTRCKKLVSLANGVLKNKFSFFLILILVFFLCRWHWRSTRRLKWWKAGYWLRQGCTLGNKNMHSVWKQYSSMSIRSTRKFLSQLQCCLPSNAFMFNHDHRLAMSISMPIAILSSPCIVGKTIITALHPMSFICWAVATGFVDSPE